MNNIFYKSSDTSLEYYTLFQNINKAQVVSTAYYAKDYPSFIVNVINAIIHDIDIKLIDYRNTKGQGEIAELYPIANNLKSFDELIELIQNSKASLGIYSSGTEGKPKLIYQNVQRLLKSVQINEKYHQSKWAFTYNPSHSAGIQLFLQAICNMATLFDLYKATKENILTIISLNHLTHLSATPTFYRMLAPYDFRCESVVSLTLNGEKSTQSLIESAKLGFPNAKIRNIYGSTESGPLMSSESGAFIVPQRLIDKVKFEDNELLISSEIISKSIVQINEWYHTGDLVNVINESPLTIEFISRKTRIINVGGQNVNPQEIEEYLLLHPSVKDVRVFGRDNKMIGQVVSAEVQLHDDIRTTEKEFIQFCNEHFAHYKIPRIIKFVESIAAGNTGKKLI